MGWVKQVLKNSGVDIIQFKAHSSRSTASSKVGRLGLSVEDIFRSLLGKDFIIKLLRTPTNLKKLFFEIPERFKLRPNADVLPL